MGEDVFFNGWDRLGQYQNIPDTLVMDQLGFFLHPHASSRYFRLQANFFTGSLRQSFASRNFSRYVANIQPHLQPLTSEVG